MNKAAKHHLPLAANTSRKERSVPATGVNAGVDYSNCHLHLAKRS